MRQESDRRQHEWLDSPPLWFGVNVLLYVALVVVFFLPYDGYLLGPDWTIQVILVELVLAAPGLLIEMILPTLILIVVLWNIRPASTIRFRIIAVVLMFLPVFLPVLLSQELEHVIYAMAVQVTFALLMVRSRLADLW
jgi:hypothetical protein